MNNSHHMANKCPISEQAHNARECSKKHALSLFPNGSSSPVLSGVEGKAAAVLTRGAYVSYVSANAAKSGKSVSPKAAKRRPQVWRAAPAKPGTPLAALRPDSGQAFFNIALLIEGHDGQSSSDAAS